MEPDKSAATGTWGDQRLIARLSRRLGLRNDGARPSLMAGRAFRARFWWGAMRAVLDPARHGVMAIMVVICTALLAGLAGGAAAVRPNSRWNGRAAVPGSQLWVSRYNGPASGVSARDAASS